MALVRAGVVTQRETLSGVNILCCDSGQKFDPGEATSDSNYTVASCLPCMVGTYQNRTDHTSEECHSCGAGKFTPSTSEPCEDCIPGKYQDHAGQPLCLSCAPGRFNDERGLQHACKACQVGTFSNETGLVTCFDCAPGRSQTKEGQALCLPCVPGTYNDETGLETECKLCASGRFSNETELTACFDCAPGRSQTQEGQALCLSCVPGTYNDETGLETECKPCDSGRFSNETELTACFNCPSGTKAEHTGSASCQTCAAGRYGDNCGTCGTGRYRASNDAAVECKPCATGRFQTQEGQALCLPCVPGRYNDETGLETECKLCDSGRFSNETELTACFDCPSGKTAESAGTVSCQQCEVGKYGVGSDCVDCPMGFFRGSGDPNSMRCERCVLGQETVSTGAGSCTQCDAGRYGVKAGASCLACPLGKFQDGKGQVSCLSNCAPGKVPNAQKTGCVRPEHAMPTDCTPRAEYFYNVLPNDTASWECRPCPQSKGVPSGTNCNQANTVPAFSELRSRNGWWWVPEEYWDSLPEKEGLLVPCPFPGDCLPSRRNESRCHRNAVAESALCALCKTGYKRSTATMRCEKCGGGAAIMPAILAASVLGASAVGAMLCRRYKARLQQHKAAVKDAWLSAKVLLTFLQVTKSMPLMTPQVTWGPEYTSFLRVFDFVNLDVMSLLQMDCLEGGVDFRVSLVVSLSLPLFVVLVTVAMYVIRRLRLRRGHSKAAELSKKQIEYAAVKLFNYFDIDRSQTLDEGELTQLLSFAARDAKHRATIRAMTAQELDLLMASVGGTRTLGRRVQGTTRWSLGRDAFLAACTSDSNPISNVLSVSAGHRHVKQQVLASTCVALTIILLQMLYAPLTANGFHYLDCMQLGDRKHLLRRDYSVECYEPGYMLFVPVALTIILGFALLLPASLGALLWRKRRSLDTPITRGQIGFLYNRYRTGSSFWDVQELVRKVLLCGCLILFPEGLRMLLALLLSVVSLCLASCFRPHQNKMVFRLTLAAHGLTVVKYSFVLHAASDVPSASVLLGPVLVVADACLCTAGVACVVLCLAAVCRKRRVVVHDNGGASVMATASSGRAAGSVRRRSTSLTHMVEKAVVLETVKVIHNQSAVHRQALAERLQARAEATRRRLDRRLTRRASSRHSVGRLGSGKQMRASAVTPAPPPSTAAVSRPRSGDDNDVTQGVLQQNTT